MRFTVLKNYIDFRPLNKMITNTVMAQLLPCGARKTAFLWLFCVALNALVRILIYSANLKGKLQFGIFVVIFKLLFVKFYIKQM